MEQSKKKEKNDTKLTDLTELSFITTNSSQAPPPTSLFADDRSDDKSPVPRSLHRNRPIFIQIRKKSVARVLHYFFPYFFFFLSDFIIYLPGRVPRQSPSLLLCDVNCYEVKLPVLIIIINIDK